MKKLLAGYWRALDKTLLLLWVTASGCSVLFLYGLFSSGLISDSGTVYKQAAFSGLGLVIAIGISLMDYHVLLKLWKLFCPVAVLLVVLTLFLGSDTRSDRAWLEFSIGSFYTSLQPSEFLKISFIATMTIHINKAREHLNEPVQLLLLGAHAMAHVGLIQLQGDSGSALIFLFIFLFMIFFAGISWKYIAAAVAAMGPVMYVVWFHIMTLDQQMRFRILYDPELDAAYAYQQTQGKLALGLGGLQGTGIFSGRHVRVPEIYNDFIFTFIGEATGFMGCLGVIVLLTAIAFKVLYNSSQAIDDSGRLLCVGVFAMMMSQMFINMGMCLSILPVVGITLPLFSAGGSSVIALYAGLGLVLSVYCHSGTGLFYTDTGLKTF